jgi:hypothetical protein
VVPRMTRRRGTASMRNAARQNGPATATWGGSSEQERPVPVFLVERYVSDAVDIAAACARLADLARDADRADARIRLIWSARVPADETWFGWFEAPDTATVADLHRRAAFPFDRISAAEVLSAPPLHSPAREDAP